MSFCISLYCQYWKFPPPPTKISGYAIAEHHVNRHRSDQRMAERRQQWWNCTEKYNAFVIFSRPHFTRGFSVTITSPVPCHGRMTPVEDRRSGVTVRFVRLATVVVVVVVGHRCNTKHTQEMRTPFLNDAERQSQILALFAAGRPSSAPRKNINNDTMMNVTVDLCITETVWVNTNRALRATGRRFNSFFKITQTYVFESFGNCWTSSVILWHSGSRFQLQFEFWKH